MAWKQHHQKKKTWLKLWASEKNVSPSESELIKDFISIWWRSREKYFLLNLFSVLKAKYEAKAFKGHAKKIYVEGDTAILWLYQITGDGINKAKLVGYFSVARKWETSADLKLSWEENQYIFKFYCSFFSFCSGREHWKLCIAKQPHARISAAGISCPSFSDHIEATQENEPSALPLLLVCSLSCMRLGVLQKQPQLRTMEHGEGLGERNLKKSSPKLQHVLLPPPECIRSRQTAGFTQCLPLSCEILAPLPGHALLH